MRNNLIFGGVNTEDYSVWVNGSDTFSAPSRDITKVAVPGRNGDLIIDNGRYNNLTLTYKAFIVKEFQNRMSGFRAAMMKQTGYQRLEDSYHPDEFRLASFAGGISPDNMGPFNRNGEFDLVFNCKPQRFLKSGEQPIQFLAPLIMASTMGTAYIPVGGPDIYVEAHCKATDTLSAEVRFYDASGTQLATVTNSLTNGQSATVAMNQSAVYWRLLVTGWSSVDDTWLRVRAITEVNSEPFRINAVMARSWKMINPTGYPTKPMIEVFSASVPYMTIDNYTNGEREQVYVFRAAASPVTHQYLDCELQYLYDEDKNNLTDKLVITTAESGAGKALVFPELGGEEIHLTMYQGNIDHNPWTGLGLIQIYPRWWKL